MLARIDGELDDGLHARIPRLRVGGFRALGSLQRGVLLQPAVGFDDPGRDRSRRRESARSTGPDRVRSAPPAAGAVPASASAACVATSSGGYAIARDQLPTISASTSTSPDGWRWPAMPTCRGLSPLDSQWHGEVIRRRSSAPHGRVHRILQLRRVEQRGRNVDVVPDGIDLDVGARPRLHVLHRDASYGRDSVDHRRFLEPFDFPETVLHVVQLALERDLGVDGNPRHGAREVRGIFGNAVDPVRAGVAPCFPPSKGCTASSSTRARGRRR